MLSLWCASDPQPLHSFPTRRSSDLNPVLIGEPGVGKTAIVEGLALRIVRGDVPEGLKNRRVVALDMGALIRSEEHTSELQSRLQLVCRLLLENKNPNTAEFSVTPHE